MLIRYITEPSYLQETILTALTASLDHVGSVPIHLNVPALTAHVISLAVDACCLTIIVPLETLLGTVRVTVTAPVEEVRVSV